MKLVFLISIAAALTVLDDRDELFNNGGMQFEKVAVKKTLHKCRGKLFGLRIRYTYNDAGCSCKTNCGYTVRKPE